MELETFTPGHWRQRDRYKSFEPAPINQEWTWRDPAIIALLESANHALGQLDAFSLLGQLDAFSLIAPDVDRFIDMHIVKEAQTSSRIEGTQTGIDEVLLAEEYVSPERRDDRREVLNYIDAINTAIARLDTFPLSCRLLRETHAILLRGVRGAHKQPGEFRTSQNWIGGSNLQNAAFIPPHPESVPDLMGDLELFWHNERITVPHLIRAALSHYQFETIHPFLDGNGRIGRLLIPLYLVHHELLHKPSLYLSAFFEQNRAAYYDALMHARSPGGLAHWIRFFLSGVAETASKGRDTFHKILALRMETDEKIRTLGKRAANAAAIVAHLYHAPYATVADMARAANISRPTAYNLSKELSRLGILQEQAEGRGKVYAFASYLRLFTGEGAHL